MLPFAVRPAAGQVGRIGSIDLLRALASIAVCWFHLTGSAGPASRAVKLSGVYGEFGVQAFFVVSGFVIPYSLRRGGYTHRGFFKFLAKRLVRVDPPYLASIALSLALLA